MTEKDSQLLHLVLLESSGNQAYIFATNKLRDVIGASELIFRVGTDFVRRSIEEVFNRSEKLSELAQKPVESASALGVELVLAVSGKALVLVRGAEEARKLVRVWSSLVLKEAPGVDATGVFVALEKDLDSLEAFHNAIGEVHRLFERSRVVRRPPQSRFQRLPLLADCHFTALPASGRLSTLSGERLASLACIKKSEAAKSEELKSRWKALHKMENREGYEKLAYFNNPDQMEKHYGDENSWLAVVHADGNGLGEIFLKFSEYVAEVKGEGATGRDYLHLYREFSQGLDDAALEAYQYALSETFDLDNSERLPVIPVVVGGDDLTLIMDGKRALNFTRHFVTRFCSLSESKDTLKPITQSNLAAKRLGAKRLGMAAGVLIAKPHYPFSISYRMAAELISEAKQAKQHYTPASSALDFHILYDTTASSLATIRNRKLVNQEGAYLTTKPLVIEARTDHEVVPADSAYGMDKNWSELHSWKRFENAVAAMNASADGLPSSQMHGVRSRLFRDFIRTQERDWQLLLRAFPKFGERWRKIAEDGGLFFQARDTNFTVFLDALEAAPFLIHETCTDAKEVQS